MIKKKCISDLQHDFLEPEETFIEFLPFIGAIKISDHFKTQNPSFKNADFYIESKNIVIELKTLKKSFKERKLEDKLKNAVETKNIEKYKHLIKKPLKRVIRKANQQIKETSMNINTTSPDGVLLLCNDKLLEINNEAILSTCCDILSGNCYSSINAIVYFTLNIYSELPSNKHANLLWMPAYRDEKSKLPNHINYIGEKWGEFIEYKTGGFELNIKTDNYNYLKKSKHIISRS